jgi:AcrR family transcriptional regulator
VRFGPGATMTAMTATAPTDEQGAVTRVGRASRRLTADARRRQLFDVALALFAEHGYAATTMDDIAEAAGVTKPLVYQHFESKRALYLELLDVFSEEMIDRIVQATSAAEGPRQQVEFGFAGYFELMVDNENAFRLLYGRDAPDDPELGAALLRVEATIAEAIDPLIAAGLDPAHRLLLAHAVVGMAEGAGRLWLDAHRQGQDGDDGTAVSPEFTVSAVSAVSTVAAGAIDRSAEAARLAAQLADFAWAGLRQVHRI